MKSSFSKKKNKKTKKLANCLSLPLNVTQKSAIPSTDRECATCQTEQHIK